MTTSSAPSGYLAARRFHGVLSAEACCAPRAGDGLRASSLRFFRSAFVCLAVTCQISCDWQQRCGEGTHPSDGRCVADSDIVSPVVNGDSVDDRDADGWASIPSGGEDCDDADPNIHPGSEDLCGDGRDQNCDGLDGVDADGDRRASTGSGGEDCDDTDAAVYPGASDLSGDAVDADCDGVDGRDADRDGWASLESGGGDCDDLDPRTHPGAAEIWYDGHDTDCDGGSDYDADGDGFETDAFGGEDCDDSLATINPAMPETWYDGVDADCDGGSDYDADGDGYLHADMGGTDCDDANADSYPGNQETLDGLDQDCDGRRDDVSLSMAHARLFGVSAGDAAGYATSFAGDVNGDGFADVLVGAPYTDDPASAAGAAYLLLGPTSGELDLSFADATFTGGTASDYLGISLSEAGDVDADGYDDFLVGAFGAGLGGEAYLVYGPVTGRWQIATLATTFVAAEADALLGMSLAGPGDVDGDGSGDVLIAAYGVDGARGAVYLYPGPFEEPGTALSPADAIASWAGEESYDHLGYQVAAPGDVDGDGIPDLLLAAPYANGSLAMVGSIYLFSGVVSGSISMDAATAELQGTLEYEFAGQALAGAGDVDADGYRDLLVGSQSVGCGSYGCGAAYLLGGPVRGASLLSDAGTRLYGSYERHFIGLSLTSAGDLDGDGFDDLAVGAQGERDAGISKGGAYLLLGSSSAAAQGLVDLSDLDATLMGEEEDDDAGSALAGGVDFDADGFPDLLVGASGRDHGVSSVGCVYVVRGDWP